jgi:hypothetical protein
MTNTPVFASTPDQKPAAATPATPQQNQGTPKPAEKPSEQQK